MKSQDVKKYKLPSAPGVYFFLGRNKKILYVGKATSLRDRVRSYFTSDLLETRSPLILKMVNEAKSIDFTKTDSVLEAIILEADLIKKFQPEFNTKEKDDKSFNCVVITKEEFPRVLVVRKRDLDSSILRDSKFIIQVSFGPFPNGSLLKDAMKIIRRIFPFRDACIPNQGKPCFNHQIGLCPGVCIGGISVKEYGKTIKHLKLFFEGKKRKLLSELGKEMKVFAKKQEFEKADKVKRTIFALQHIQDVSLIKSELNPKPYTLNPNFRIESYDIAHMSGKNMVGVMTVMENGEVNKNEYRKFIIRGQDDADDTKALREVLERRLRHGEWKFPNIIVVDGGQAQESTAKDILEESGLIIPVVAVTKNEKHKPENILGDRNLIAKHKREILLANSEAHRFAIGFHRKLRGKIA